MADKVGSVILDVVNEHCPSHVCPYRQGDNDKLRKNLQDTLEKKLEYRVSDGVEVRAQKKRVKDLEAALQRAIDLLSKNKKPTMHEMLRLKKALLPSSSPRKDVK